MLDVDYPLQSYIVISETANILQEILQFPYNLSQIRPFLLFFLNNITQFPYNLSDFHTLPQFQ